jgi:ankyrin repeat protein
MSGVDIDGPDDFGESALITAVKCSNKSMVNAYIKAGASLEIKNKHGDTFLIKAIRNLKIDMCKIICSGATTRSARRAFLDIKDEYSETALMIAVECGNKEIVEILVKSGASLEIKDKFRDTALMKAIQHDKKDIIEILKN